MKEYVAYEENEFTIEWYYNEKGESRALDFFILTLFKLMGDQRVSSNSVSVDFRVLLSQFSFQILGVISLSEYDPQNLKRKLAKIIPKIDETRI